VSWNNQWGNYRLSFIERCRRTEQQPTAGKHRIPTEGFLNEVRQEYLDFALKLARTAEEEILPRYRNVTASLKPDGTEVTEADREAERVMREVIEQRYPNHDILGEEHGATNKGSRIRWVLDPVDGTASFTLAMPIFGTLVAVLEDDEPTVGVIHLPAIGETVYAAKGMGCWFRAEGIEPTRVQVNRVSSLKVAIASCSGVQSSDIFSKEGERQYGLSRVIRGARKFRFCGDCSQYALLCRGRLHVALDPVMSPWDIAALIPCVEEAGGVASSITGQRERVVYSGSLLTTCGPQLHEELVGLLQP
jgi:histidinol-phosphatase